VRAGHCERWGGCRSVYDGGAGDPSISGSGADELSGGSARWLDVDGGDLDWADDIGGVGALWNYSGLRAFAAEDGLSGE
jgi:hypothetical protein